MNILIVEDEPSDLKLATVVLESAGHRIVGTATAADVAPLVLTLMPDVVLMDLALPRTGGLDLIRQLKANPQTAGAPVVAVTGYPNQFSHSRVIDSGCDAYFQKPINTRTFSDDLVQIVARHKKKPGDQKEKQMEAIHGLESKRP